MFFIDSASSTKHALDSNASYEKVSNRVWARYYDTALVHHGDLYLAIDGFASNVTKSTTNTTLSIDISWSTNVTWPIQFSEDRILIQNLTNLTDLTDPNIRDDWLNLTKVFDCSAKRGHPCYAHIVQSFSRKVPPRDRILFSFNFLIIVIACNATKLATMVYVLIMEKDNFIVTQGDCAASFLQTPDPWTAGMCMYSKEALVDSARRRVGELPLLRRARKYIKSCDPRIWQKFRRPCLTPIYISGSLASHFMWVASFLPYRFKC